MHTVFSLGHFPDWSYHIIFKSKIIKFIAHFGQKWLKTRVKKNYVPSGCSLQEYFLAGQVLATFHFQLIAEQGPRKVVCQLTQNKSKPRLVQGKHKLRGAVLL